MIEDAIRYLFWAIAKLFLSASDWMYEMLNSVVNLNLADSNEIKYTWLFFIIFLSFASFVRIVFILLRKSADENETIDIGSIGRKITYMFLVVALSTISFFFILQVPSEITKIYNNTISYGEKMVPSTAVISATAKTPITSKLSDMSTTDEVIGIDTIDDKLNDEENGDYIYFYSYAELILAIIGAFVVMCVQLNIVIDCGMRLFLNIFRFCIGFIPISSMVENVSTCGDWVKDIISDSLTMACTLIFTNLVFGLMSVSQITQLNGIIRIVIFTVALMAVYKSGEIIAKYMGASNLSSGGRAGTMLMGMGAMAAARATTKIISNSTKSFMGNLNNGLSLLGSKLPNPPHFPSGGTGRTPTPPTSSSGNKSSNTANENNKNSYFATNGLNQQTMQSSYQNHENTKDSIIDQNPTSSLLYSNNDKNNVNSSLHNNLSTTPKSYLNSKKIDNFNKNKYNSSNNTSPLIKQRGFAFIDEPSQNHLYKDSTRIYKPSIRDRYLPNLSNLATVSGVI